MSSKTEKKLFLMSFCFLCLLAVFAYGVSVGEYRLWPHDVLAEMKEGAETLLKHGSIAPKEVFVTAAANAPRKRITLYGALHKGYYAFLGWNNPENQYAVWLYDQNGKLLHTWNIDYASLDTDNPDKTRGADMPHGMHLMADGSLIVSFSQHANIMARVDACGKPIWIKDGVLHHLITADDDGALWSWKGKRNDYGQFQYIVRFNPEDGSTLKEIDLVKDIIRPLGENAFIFGVRPDFQPVEMDKDARPDNPQDIFHPNDVDVLSAEMEDAFPGFSAGDLLISLRNINLVAVLDPDTLKVKWWSRGPWRHQHDPDFTADGKISVFDNNPGRGRSEILKIDPQTRNVTDELLAGDFFFYSEWLGVHQYLPDGSLLLLSAQEGRVTVLDKNGKRLFEFNNVIDDKYNGYVENAVWLPEDYFEHVPSCP
jgi:Na+-transporting methylmalonyl-CoA/oxaloacetate decarboxylase gamma subunit